MSLYKHLIDAGFEVELIGGEMKFIHPELGEAVFPDWSTPALMKIHEQALQLKANYLKARDEQSIYHNHKESK